MYPLTFQPIFKERVWGGRRLEALYGKPLPPKATVGESWEIADRPGEGDVSAIAHGPWAGRTLRWVMEHHRAELLGSAASDAADQTFPLLVKLLDALDALSVQVHPAPAVAAVSGGEPKTEMWYVAEADPGALLYAGLKSGTSRARFEQGIRDGTVAEWLHRIPVQSGDALYLPSGRVHAIGAGLVLFEIQQNSDTTYRVFDWNRAGLDGRPRALHVDESLASIDFDDFEPALIGSRYSRNEQLKVRFLVREGGPFTVDACQMRRDLRIYLTSDAYQIVGLLRGRMLVQGGEQECRLAPGEFCLLPASLKRVRLTAERLSEFLHVQPGAAEPAADGRTSR